MNRDRIYDVPLNPVDAFKFDRKVANVFPDMIKRSVPGYELIIEQIGMLAQYFAKPVCNYYDLGASLGAATQALRENINHTRCRIFAVDNSQEMIHSCRDRLATLKSSVPVDFICSDIRDIEITQAQIVVLNFTLQFIPPDQRDAILGKIFNGLKSGGILILSEKVLFENLAEQDRQTNLHHAFKRFNGYSDLEISQKRTALENVLIPETVEQNIRRLENAGFPETYLWFQCFNFASILAIK